ncbi:Hypothetical protein R9X50_00674200 [Acrodontium crateriforme]|uniref:t-SNARE affecting a late Golgi compartment protein 1 n=1 Tax=Acrodontium crateriforme TaxID=150365 RepID=A0AAQ3M8Y5_9PEZI|nr:Hypothetical protein R9X50_00674200 [Acrodontium crateriforme]
MADPFLEVQADVLSSLDQSRPLLASYLRIRSSASSASSPELLEARHELESTLTDLSTDVQDLIDSVKAVEGDPRRYGLDAAEVERRRTLVADVGREMDEMRRQLNETVTAADKRYESLANPDDFDDDPLAGQGDDDDYGAWEEQRQMEIMHEQDEALDGVFKTVGNLRMQADTMGRELEEQAEMLEETENITDRVGSKLGAGMKQMRYVIEKNEGSHPLLQQTPLSVNPFIDLPKPPTLPHNYVSIPSTLPPSCINVAPAPSGPDLPAYVISASGSFSAHPSTIIAQNKALLAQIEKQKKEAREKVEQWEKSIRDRDLAEKRRKAPGWLDSENKLLEPEKAGGKQTVNLMDEPEAIKQGHKTANDVEDLGTAMDRAFGRSEMG